MKNTVKIFLFAIILYGCSYPAKTRAINKPDLELQVINDILPQLIPVHPPCMVALIEGEKKEDYDKRLQAFYTEVDSVGKKIEIVSQLTKLDSNFIEVYKRFNKTSFAQHVLNAQNEDRRIDSTMISGIDNIKIVLVKEPRRTIGGLTDCYTLGLINLSRVGFNSDSTRAALTYFIDDGSCTGGENGIIDAELIKGKWQIKSK